MLEGITILSQNTQSEQFEFWFSLILFGIMSLVMIILTILVFNDGEIGGGIFCIFISLIIVSITIFLPISIYKGINTTEYKVTINDGVDFKEFNDKYKIVNQEGQIYTIVEKE